MTDRSTPELPPRLLRNVELAHGDRGRAWIASFSELLPQLESAWNLDRLIPFPNLTYNFVAAAVRNGADPVVLKVGVPIPELLSEIEALRHYGGSAAARLLDSDPQRGAMLIESVRPGTPLAVSGLGIDEEARIAASVMRKLRRPPPADHHFPDLRRWGRSLLEAPTDGPLPGVLLERGIRLFSELLDSTLEQTLLHGDLHHDNILAAEREQWLAIDPKGVLGDPAYEAAVFLLNPRGSLHRADARESLTRRVDILASELGYDRRRILGWTTVQAILSACWFAEEGGGWEENLAAVEVLAAIR